MTSRLDRLFVLLESGSSASTRSAAAKQLGEVQRLHPHELHTLLGRLSTLLKASSWDTRVAAAQAVAAILSATPQWNPTPIEIKKEKEEERKYQVSGRLRLQQINMEQVLSNSSHLMGSEGNEYDLQEDNKALQLDVKERLAYQRQQLNARLGLDFAAKIGLDMSGMLTNEDLNVNDIKQNNEDIDKKKHITEVMKLPNDAAGLSSREMNRARRKARQAVTKQRSREPPNLEDGTTTASNLNCDSVDIYERKRIKLDPDVKVKEENLVFVGEPTPDATGSWGTDVIDWPFESFFESLCVGLFSSAWETRHGAATALRELLRTHGKGAGRLAFSTVDEMEEQHQFWLEDTATRLLCVLALDRFGDFVSDAVVAPVRETAAQCLGAALSLMSPSSVHQVKVLLLQLLQQKEWEARHGGLLGLKYMLAVREDLVASLLPDSFQAVLTGLSDSVDDVGAVAAAALIPVAPSLIRLLPESVAPVVSRLWELLGEQDELASACNSFMGLLAAILSLPESQPLLPPISLSEVVPRLWPYLCHSTSSVRRATLQTLRTLTQVHSNVTTVAHIQWNAQLLQDGLRHIFQRVLVEHIGEVQEIVEEVWNNLVNNSDLVELLHAACPFVSTWICLTMQPSKLSFDSTMLIQSRSLKERRSRLSNDLYSQGSDSISESLGPQQKWFVGGSETTPLAIREMNVMRARCMAARMLGLLSSKIVKPAPGIVYTPEIESPIECYVKVLVAYLLSKSALQRTMIGLIVAEWARIDTIATRPCPPALKTRLHVCLSECLYFDEIAVSFTRLIQETKDFIATLKHYKICPENIANIGTVLTLEQISALSDNTMAQIISTARLKTKVATSLEERRRSISTSAQCTVKEQQQLTVSSLAALAGACTLLQALPDKLNPVVKPLMESIKRETDERLQTIAARALACLVSQCINREPCPNTKIISNLCTLLCSDSDFTPKIITSEIQSNTDSGVDEGSRATTPIVSNDQVSGILTLTNMQKTAEKAALRRSNSTTGRGPGRPPIASDVPLEEIFVEDDTQKSNQIQRRGAALALTSITSFLERDVPTKLPRLWELIVDDLKNTVHPETFDPSLLLNNPTAAEILVNSLQVLEVCAGSLHLNLLPILMELALPRLGKLLTHPYRAVRHLAARCLASLAKLSPVSVMELIVEQVLPLLGAVHFNTHRQGAIEAIACVVEALQFDIVPYVVLLIVPLLGRMSDQNENVRLMATHSFATLVQLMPLDGAVPEPINLSESLRGQRERERAFLRQLLTPSTIPDYVIPIPIQAELRSYQQAGINWLAFLNQYKLHGILCDDMGLGKTLQSICMLASDHYYRDQRYRETKAIDSAPLPSLVICPPTLTGHWVYEVEKFLSAKYLRPLQFVGPPAEREKLRHKVKTHNLIVASYEIVRKDIDFFSSIKWNYCILDEGHIIKNGKTKSSKAIKQLTANHRLILSGTPIQNNVLELWSLFDFLMPGFLGTEKQFTARFSRPILASRDPKSSSKEQEAGAIAMESLHRQVLPFLLRRMKEDVLDDLPPKITQDYYCELSSLQEQLYEDFSRSQAHQSLQESFSGSGTVNTAANTNGGHTNHIFQALRYLQNVCNHPKLVLTPAHPLHTKIMAQLQQQHTTLDNIQHAAKLPALKQLLLDLGIGVDQTTSTEIVINQHRALIFCQLKVMLDILENDLFKTHLPSVTYLRLDGSIPPAQRHTLVTRFNNDPSIDVLLLTTQVGGLGLNLTGADTVIFVEHDWNPTRDLQAMDRAHRIGQRRVVNVYRLITRHTLEEKIMGLQKFKLLTANTVISGDNSSLSTMGTGDLLDLFSNQPTESGGHHSSNDRSVSNQPATMKTVLDNLPDLWDQKQYEEEYDLTNFVQNLRN